MHALRTSGSIFLSHRCNKNLYYIHIYIYISPYISYKFNDFFINYQSRNLVFFISITISSVIFAFNSPAFLFLLSSKYLFLYKHKFFHYLSSLFTEILPQLPDFIRRQLHLIVLYHKKQIIYHGIFPPDRISPSHILLFLLFGLTHYLSFDRTL